ncbi:MAG: spermidine synthase [Candidatus Nanopelagicales bacterium]
MLISRLPVRLVLASTLMLFTELALIRWLGANVLHLSYFSNIVLLGSFLGIGLGFLRTKPDARPPWYFVPMMGLLIVLVLVVPLGVDRTNSDLIFFTSLTTHGPPAWVVLPIVFVVTAAVLYGPGYLTGQCFFGLPRLSAYRYDLIGSITGITAFTLLSFLGSPSVVWGIVFSALSLALLWPSPRAAADVRQAGAGVDRAAPRSQAAAIPRLALGLAALGAVVAVGGLTYESVQPNVRWSPYYKIETSTQQTTIGEFTTILANGVPHQAVTDVNARIKFEPFYTIPYERSLREEPGKVLIVGAGTGTDVALALLKGATSVDAVEIDPEILNLGKTINPNKPFSDPRVTYHNNDGRAFIERTGQKFDTVLFALPDSLTLVAGASQLRLESYLFTQPAMDRVNEILTPDGVYAMYNYYREPWLVGRLGASMAAAFDHPPCIDLNTQFNSAVLVVAKDSAMQKCSATDNAATLLAGAPAPVDDDRPFLYLKTPHIPGFYLAVLVMILLLSFGAVRLAVGKIARTRRYADLFLLGAAFMLLETRAVTMFALLFGTTWVVNAIVFGGVLVVVLCAVEFTAWLKRTGRKDSFPLPVAYGVLLASLAVAWLVPLQSLLALPMGVRIVAAVAITFLPVFTANVVFASRFDASEEPGLAFGVNLLGSMVGGTLEYLALIVGYRSLLMIAALLYLAALTIGARSGATARPAAVAAN